MENEEVELENEIKMNNPNAVFLSSFLISNPLHWIHVYIMVIRSYLLRHLIFWKETCDMDKT